MKKQKQKRINIEEASLKWWKPYALITLIGTLLYLQVLFFDFTYLDDNILILDYQYFLRNLSNIDEAFKQDVFHVLHSKSSFYRPILTLSFMMDAQLGKASPLVFHMSNIIFHLVSSCLVFLLFVKLKYKEDIALFFSLIFAVHPVITQAVGWIPGRNDLLLGVFILASFISFISFLKTRMKRYYLSYIIFFILSLLTKETAIALPFLCILYMRFVIKERVIYSSNKWFIIGPLIVTGFWFLIRKYSLQDGAGISLLELSHSFIQGLPGLIQQTGKILFPFNLSVMPTVQDTSLIFGILAIITLVIVFYKSKDKRIAYTAFGFCWFVFFLLPTFAVKASSPENNFQHEHRLYVPMIGFFILFMETEVIRKLSFKNKRTLFICAAIIIVLSLLAFNYSKRFKNTFNFWENAAANSPHSSAAQKGLGNAYFRAGKFDKAKAQFLKTIRLDPNETIAHNNLGLIYMNNNLFKEAEGEFKREIAINPQFDKAYFNLGLVYSKQGNIQEAKTLWKKTLSMNPENFDASNSLARIYYGEGKTEEARNMWENILRVNPDYLNAYKNLVNYYYDQKDFSRAIYYVEELRRRGVEIPPQILKALGL